MKAYIESPAWSFIRFSIRLRSYLISQHNRQRYPADDPASDGIEFATEHLRAMKISETWRAMSRTSPFGTSAVLTVGTNAVLAMFGLATGVLAARLLGPNGRGELAAIQAWPGFIATIAMLGMSEAVVYYAARESDRAGHYVASAVTLALMSTLPFVVAGYLAMPLLLSAQSGSVISGARWYLLLAPIYALWGIPHNSLRARHEFAWWNGFRVAAAFGWLTVLVVAWLAGHATPKFVAAGHLIALSLLILPVLSIVMRRVPGPFYPEVRQWNTMFWFGLPCMVSTMPQVLNFRLDQMLMAGLLPARSLGLYAVAVAWSGATSPLVGALSSILLPRVASQPDKEQQSRALAQGNRLAVFAALVAAAVVAALTPRALPLLFGAGFTPAIHSALVLVLASTIATFNVVTEEGLKGLGHPQSVMWAEFGGLAVTVVSLWLMLRPLGIMGASLASLFGYSTVTVFLVASERSLTGCSLTTLLLPTTGELHSSWRRIRLLLKGVDGLPAKSI